MYNYDDDTTLYIWCEFSSVQILSRALHANHPYRLYSIIWIEFRVILINYPNSVFDA